VQKVIVNKWRGRIIAFAPLFVWIGVIFYLSSGQGSMDETSRFIRPLLRFLFPQAGEDTLTVYHGYIRKAAHFTEYAVLAFMAYRAVILTKPLSVWKFLLPLVLVVVVASVDEFNQSFEATRTSSFWDVLLDIAGGAFMTAVLWVIYRRRRYAA
jgi:VanZ family protein